MVKQYLKNLDIPVELRAHYRITSLPRGSSRRSRRARRRRYDRIVREARAQLPHYNEEAQKQLESAGKYERIRSTHEIKLKRIQLALSVVNLVLVIEDYKESYSDTQHQKLITHLNFVLELADFIISATKDRVDEKTLLGLTHGVVGEACGFISGIIETSDHLAEGIQSIYL